MIMRLIAKYWRSICVVFVGSWIIDCLIGISLIVADWKDPLPYSITAWEISIIINILSYLVAIIVTIRMQLIEKSHALRLATIPFILLTILNIILGYSEQCQIFGVVDALSGAVLSDARTCFYFSLVTWTTLGYGDFRPTAALRLIAASEALLGYVSMALFIGGVIYVMGTRKTQDR
jgi:prepilin signal peptidase PulO-like enzyme (type II secretory pathway)